METPKVFESEYKICLILWENEPIKSGNLVKLCKERLGWKSTTTYTVIKRLSERGVIKNENTIVSSIVSKEQIQEAEIVNMVEKTFEGSIDLVKEEKGVYQLPTDICTYTANTGIPITEAVAIIAITRFEQKPLPIDYRELNIHVW